MDGAGRAQARSRRICELLIDDALLRGACSGCVACALSWNYRVLSMSVARGRPRAPRTDPTVVISFFTQWRVWRARLCSCHMIRYGSCCKFMVLDD